MHFEVATKSAILKYKNAVHVVYNPISTNLMTVGIMKDVIFAPIILILTSFGPIG